MAKCAIGGDSLIAKPWAVTPAVAPANMAQVACNASAQSTATATNMSGCCWWKQYGRRLRWQPNWHARQKYLEKLRVGVSLKKKMVVALARQLAIDLWRWRTGRATAAELGWTVTSATRQMLRSK